MKRQFRAASWTAVGRISAPFLIMGVSLWMLTDVLDPPFLSSLPETIAALPPGLFLLAAAFCGISLWAVARYDGLAHRHFRTRIDPALARQSGLCAIAIAQTVGFGVFTGAAVRWRMLPHLGLKSAMRLSVFVSVTFMSALAFLAALACLILPAPSWAFLPAVVIAAGLPLALITLSFAPVCARIRHHMRIPSLQAVRAILGWAGLDVLAAALAFYILIPAPDLGFAAFLPVFLLALAAAMLSGAPGGVGPFELTLISLLPNVAPADLITAVLVFRTLYYAIPAVLAVLFVFCTKHAPPVAPAPPVPQGQQLAELGVLAQNGGIIRHHRTGSYALWFTQQTATLLFDPASGRAQASLADLKGQAASHALSPCIYKCGARTAVAARKSGWCVVQVAQDCVINLPAFDLSHPDKRGLRRKLRKAQMAGVTVTRAPSGTLPLQAMAAIDTLWQTAQGPARGGTMGRFCPDYLAVQDVYLAHLDGQLIAYASFHSDPSAPCLDLMRQLPDVPQGTMHLLVKTAIDAARTEGKPAFSLAAVPYLPAWSKYSGPFRRSFSNPGLRQFKAGFAPVYVPKYAAAPSAGSLVLALADIASEVHHPRPLPTFGAAHKQHEEYEVALECPPWKGEPNS
ncbi:phosphatidylglycerol lysyltransferase domain-containing protein [Sulfitobacter geojensis]|uniref:phosphatidylglycerol lysyltransferase domain-containing protein n=1 Tax=Sulfitobacter geojensis TaxID=1342299 RepID=UPI0036DBB790